jgi:hypothetical protein
MAGLSFEQEIISIILLFGAQVGNRAVTRLDAPHTSFF